MAKIKVIEVAYKGVPQAIIDLLGGRLSFALVEYGQRCRPSESREADPPCSYLGQTGAAQPRRTGSGGNVARLDVVPWLGLVAPAGTPAEIVAKLYDATASALAKAGVKAALANIGVNAAPINPSDFSRFIRSEIPKWAKFAKLAGIQPQ